MFGFVGFSIGAFTDYDYSGLECGWAEYYLESPIYGQQLVDPQEWTLVPETCVEDYFVGKELEE